MLLASQAARVSARVIKQPDKLGGRFIHFAPRVPRSQGAAQRLSAYSRNLVSRFVAHLTTPGTLRSPSTTVTRSLHSGVSPTIQQGFSLPVRTALSRPLHAPYLPRAPTVPRCTTQVGLGTARNFSSARPVFQNLVENVPVAGRAFWEADWDIKVRQERDKMMSKPTKSKGKTNGGKGMLKQKDVNAFQSAEGPITSDSEFDHYFFAATTPKLTTYLLIPLAPTPTSRTPLPSSSPSFHPSFLPLPALTSLHAEHTTHALRVSALFARLDAAKVWDRGVTCSAYSHGRGEGDTVCMALKVGFVGWTADEVRGIIGESGSGWCVLEEIRSDGGINTPSDDLSETSSIPSVLANEMEDGEMSYIPGANAELMDPAASFVLPTLDFSSSFLGEAHPSGPLPSDNVSAYSDSDFDVHSDFGSDFSADSNCGIESAKSPLSSASAGSGFGFGFSSEFASRVGSEYEPQATAFL